jgi:hypothetical protein
MYKKEGYLSGQHLTLITLNASNHSHQYLELYKEAIKETEYNSIPAST